MKKFFKKYIAIIIIFIVFFIGIECLRNIDKSDNSENINKDNKTINETPEIQNNSISQENKIDLSTLTVEEKDKIGKEKVEKFLEIYRNDSPKGVLVTLGLLEEGHEFKPEEYVDRFYAKTNISYEKFKDEMLKYMTEEMFNGYFNNLGFKEIENNLAVSDIGEIVKNYEITKLELLNSEDEKMNYYIEYKDSDSDTIQKANIVACEKNNDYVIEKYEEAK